MSLGFTIGNGTSRSGFDLGQLRGLGTIIGCNWLYRDFSPDIIVSLDVGVRKEIAKIPIEERSWQWLTMGGARTSIILDGVRVMSLIQVNRTFFMNSGIVACSYLAKVKQVAKIYMLGFDFFRSFPGMERNDVYADEVRSHGVINKWFAQLSADCSRTEFIRVGPVSEHDKDYFDKLAPYFTFIDYPEFENRLNEQL